MVVTQEKKGIATAKALAGDSLGGPPQSGLSKGVISLCQYQFRD
jgi:hypothetical protein